MADGAMRPGDDARADYLRGIAFHRLFDRSGSVIVDGEDERLEADILASLVSEFGEFDEARFVLARIADAEQGQAWSMPPHQLPDLFLAEHAESIARTGILPFVPEMPWIPAQKDRRPIMTGDSK
jgi:hypothetical protein